MSPLDDPDMDEEHSCRKCGKSFATKYTMQRHMEAVHRKRPHSPEDGESEESEEEDQEVDTDDEEEEEEEEEPSDGIWRKLLKRGLRSIAQEETIPEDIIEIEDKIRKALYGEMVKLENEHYDLIRSPMYIKIAQTKKRVLRLMDEDEDYDEAWRAAFDQRRILIEDFLRDNKDVHDNYDESSDSDGDEDEEEEADDE
jgi:hypothetical protein